MSFRWVDTSLSNDFMTTDVRATGLQLSNPVVFRIFGTGVIIEHLKEHGTTHCSSNLLKICVKIGASWLAQSLRHAGETSSEPEAFLVFCFRKTWHTSSSQILNAG